MALAAPVLTVRPKFHNPIQSHKFLTTIGYEQKEFHVYLQYRSTKTIVIAPVAFLKLQNVEQKLNINNLKI